MSWEAIQLEGGDVHVHPLRDLIKHDPDDCVCGPTTEPVPREDGSMGWLISHHALDAREQKEASMNDDANGLLDKATVVHLQPDDVLVFSNVGEYGSEAVEFIKAAFPEKKVIMFAGDINLDVLRDLVPCPYCALPDGWDACPIHRDGE